MIHYLPQYSQFLTRFDGATFIPGQPGYDEARAVWNSLYDRVRPAIIAQPYSAEAVATALRFAREHALKVAVRGGGHSPAGLGTIEGGLMLDLRSLRNIEVDPLTRKVRLEPGLTWGEVAAALHPHGLAITAGDVASVGVAGLTQGGGIGWFVRRYGLAIDRLRAVELVTAQGEQLRASDTQHPEVFWAVRGAGANLGVITALEFEAHPAGMIYGGMLAFDATTPGEAARLMGTFARLAHDAPETLTMQGLFLAAPPAPFVPPQLVGKTVFAVLACSSADVAEGEAALAPIRAMGTPAFDLIGPMPYPALFEFTAEASQPGYRHTVRSGFLRGLTPAALEHLGREVQTMQPGQVVQLRPLGGQLARVSAEATAFSHRDAPFLMMVGQAVPDAALDDAAWATTERMWATVSGLSTGLYGNFAGQRDLDPARAAYSAQTQARVARVKAQLDPDNVLARNVNIRPAAREAVLA